MATSNAVRGASLLTNFWKAVEEEIYAAGGTEEHLGLLVTMKMRPVIREFAQNVVNSLVSAFTSFREMIAAGKFDYTYGLAGSPEEIRGQVFHPATGEVDLDHPGVILTAQQVWEKYGNGDLSELLDYGIKNPETQCEHPIGIIWKDDAGQFSCAVLRSRFRRTLGVYQVPSDDRWSDDYRYLRRK